MTEHRKFFGLLCAHEWAVAEEYALLQPWGQHGRIGTLYILQCKHCGDIKKKQA